MKKVLSLLLSVVLCFSLGVVGMAANDTGLGTTYINEKSTSATLSLDNVLKNHFYGLGSLTWCDESKILEIRSNADGKIVVELPAGWSVKEGTLELAIPGLGVAHIARCTHTWGSWVIVVSPTASTSGRQMRECTVCGETEYEDIPATGSPSTPSSPTTTTETVKNDDGTTTEKVTNTVTGTVTETTVKEDGTKQVVMTEKDGTVTETVSTADGGTTELVTKSDGSGTSTVTTAEGVKAEAETTAKGETTASITVPETVEKAIVTVPVPKSQELTPGTVAVIVHEDGTEEVIKTSVPGENGMSIPVTGSVQVKLVDAAIAFDDVPKWASDSVAFTTARELFNGTTSTTFAPNEDMTRAMMATVLYRLEGAASKGEAIFPDIVGNTWYSDAAAWANEKEIVNGIAGEFRGNESVTRAQMATMLYRYAKLVGLDTTVQGDISIFTDSETIPDWSSDALSWAVGCGLLTGVDGNALDPTGTATRAQVATVLERTIRLMTTSK